MEKSYDTKVLNKFSNDSPIISARANKSNALVIMNKTVNDSKIQSHLNDTNTYVKSTHDQTDQFVQKIIKELRTPKENGRITPQLYNKFLPRGVFYSKFYGLPTFHKQGIPLRSIVASTKSPSSSIGKWLCSAFRPLLHSWKSYINNSVDLVEKFKQIDISENSILSRFDIVSMYNSIDVSKSE